MTTVQDLNTIAQRGLVQPRDFVVLKPYQLLGYDKLISTKARLLLSLDKGLGKTILDYLALEDLGAPKTVVCCTTNAYTTWEQEAIKWKTAYGDRCQIVEGTAYQRGCQWKNPDALVFVTTPNAFLADCGFIARKGVRSDKIVPDWIFEPGWALILDEFQRFLRNHGTKKKPNKFFVLLKSLPFTYFIPTSGSALSKGPQDIWPILHILNPKRYPSYYKYIYTWCDIDDAGFGMVINGPKPGVAENFRRYVGQDYFHRTKAMVADQLPPKNRFFHDVHLPEWQQKLHDELNEQLWTETPDGNFLFAKNTLAKIFQLRLALICPTALHESYPVGIGVESIADTCEFEGIDRWVLNTPFRKPIPYLRAYLESRGLQVWVLWGGISKQEREAAIAAWAAGKGVIIQTIKYAQSYELIGSPYGFFLGYEWDPEDNKQAEDRQNRLTSTEPTFIYYVRHLGAYDENVIDILVQKSVNMNILWGTYGLNTFTQKVRDIDLTKIVGQDTFTDQLTDEEDIPDENKPGSLNWNGNWVQY